MMGCVEVATPTSGSLKRPVICTLTAGHCLGVLADLVLSLHCYGMDYIMCMQVSR
jgi:hypothetical protein